MRLLKLAIDAPKRFLRPVPAALAFDYLTFLLQVALVDLRPNLSRDPKDMVTRKHSRDARWDHLSYCGLSPTSLAILPKIAIQCS
jgi:hypothetical protein